MRPISPVVYIVLFATFLGLGQNRDMTENEMAVVYFFETTDRTWISSSYVALYDGQEPIGMIASAHYVRHECPPGEHLFYSESDENKSFVEANLLAGKVYLIEVDIRLGGLSYIPSWGPYTNKAHMKPVNPKQKIFDIEQYRNVLNKKRTKHFYWESDMMNKAFLKSAEKNKSVKYQKILNKYYKKKEKEKVEVLYPQWHIESETILLESLENDIEETS